ncbi:U4/U6-U5 snRNP complex subunit lsm6 [Cryomyces antarcticus]|nr:U4/U6-U5 snRNP complex subunit lsm6 [Cryomyces antarcticus]
MNIALEQTKEYVNGKMRKDYGDAFVRGNNVGQRTSTGHSQERRRGDDGLDELLDTWKPGVEHSAAHTAFREAGHGDATAVSSLSGKLR